VESGDTMSFCKWCAQYTWGRMFAFMFVCDDCLDKAFDYYTERDKEEACR